MFYNMFSLPCQIILSLFRKNMQNDLQMLTDTSILVLSRLG